MAKGNEAVWIWRSERVTVNDFAYFRKEFRVEKGVVSANLQVSAHNTAHVYLDGVKIGGYGSPAPTDPGRRKYYTVHETAGLLTAGVHCLTADALYLGGSGQNYVNGLPGFWLLLEIEYGDGSVQTVASGPSWDTLADAPHASGTPYQQNRRISAIEDFDARKWDPAWRLPGWNGNLPIEKAKEAKAGTSEWPMERQDVQEGAVESEIAPVRVPLPNGGDEDHVQVFDTGRIVSGWPKIRLKGIPGATVRLRYSEDLDERGRVKHNVCNETSENYYDQYTMRGDKEEAWAPDFSYKAFRYVEVTGYPEEIHPGKGLVICFAHTDIRQEGTFECSDPHLNALFDICIQTQKNNVLGQVVDCPHREQAQYLADTDLQAETLLYNFDSLALLRKTLADFADAQLEDGTFPFVAPINYDHPDFHLQIPEWDLHFATLLWKLYESTGQISLLEEFYEPLRKLADFGIEERDGDTGLIPVGRGWNISDWPYPTVEHEGRYYSVQQIKWVRTLRILSRICLLTGRDKERDDYARHADSLTRCILEQLFDPATGTFRDSSGSSAAHQGVTALALHAGIVPESSREAALAHVAGRPWECRTVLSLPLLRVLFDNGREAEAYALISRKEYPGWGYMVAQGARTLWEGWDDIESHSHAWNGYPARLLQEYVVGIRMEKAAFAETVIRPYIPDDLEYAEAEVRTPHGSVYARWEIIAGGESVTFKARIPEGMSARFEWHGQTGGLATRQLAPGSHEWTLERAESR